MENKDIRIRLRAYDSKLLDNSTMEIINRKTFSYTSPWLMPRDEKRAILFALFNNNNNKNIRKPIQESSKEQHAETKGKTTG